MLKEDAEKMRAKDLHKLLRAWENYHRILNVSIFIHTHKKIKKVYNILFHRKEILMNNNYIRTNIVLDKHLLESALKETGIKTRRQLVDFALPELMRHHQQRKILELKGHIDWQGDLDTMRAGQ